jgi:hypothetical protein
MRKALEIGGIVAGAVMLLFGIAAIALAIDARSTVRDSIKQEQVFFSSADDPAVAKYAPDWAGEQVVTGDQARAFAQIMREHTLSGTEGLTYAQMGRFQATDPKGDDGLGGTNDEAKAVKDEATGQPVSNARRNIWVTETALSTALNMSYLAENLALFGLVVGIALLLTGIGLIILAVAVLGARAPVTEGSGARATSTPATG